MKHIIYCDIHPLPNETFIEAVCRVVPNRQRALSGLALKIICIRMEPENYSKGYDKKVIAYIDIIRNMTDEEYDKSHPKLNDFI